MFILWSHWTRKQDLDLTPYSTCGCAAFVSPPCAQMSGFWKQRWISGLHWGSFSVVGLSGCTAHANMLVSSDSGWRPVDWSETSGVPVMSVSQADEEITDKPEFSVQLWRRRLPVTEEQLCENLRKWRELQSDANPWPRTHNTALWKQLSSKTRRQQRPWSLHISPRGFRTQTLICPDVREQVLVQRTEGGGSRKAGSTFKGNRLCGGPGAAPPAAIGTRTSAFRERTSLRRIFDD